MNRFEANKISREEFLKINENDLMFITNPGRMGDEDGSTFVVKKDNKFVIYRVDGWMYRNRSLEEVEFISLDDVLSQFPKWRETWKNNGHNENSKYTYSGMD